MPCPFGFLAVAEGGATGNGAGFHAAGTEKRNGNGSNGTNPSGGDVQTLRWLVAAIKRWFDPMPPEELRKAVQEHREAVDKLLRR